MLQPRPLPVWRPLWQLPALALGWTLLAYGLARAAGLAPAFPSPINLALPPLVLWGLQTFLSHSASGRALVAALDENDPRGSGEWDRAWAWGGLALLGLALLFLELRQPYYFTQDDNYCQFLPHQLAGLRGALAQHRFPDFDPFEFAGSPLAGQGVYALTYPLLWACWLLVHGLGHDTWLLEALAWAHLLLGYAAFQWVARLAGARAWGRSLGALSWCLGGYLLIVGRGWFYMLPWALWLPLLLGGLLALKQGASRVGVFALALSIGLGFHSGNLQLWSYAVGFGGLLGLAWTLAGAWPKRALGWAAVGLGLGLGIALPLLWVQLKTLQGNLLIQGQGQAPGDPLGLWLPFLQPHLATFLPSLAGGGSPWQDQVPELMDQGSLVPLVAALAALAWLGLRRPRWDQAWAPLALLAWVAALGAPGGLWTLQHWAGPAAGFEHPFKLLLFVQAFGALAAAVLLPRLARSKATRNAVVAVGLLLLGAHVWRSRGALYLWSENPYAPLPAAEARALDALPGRIAGVSPRWAHRDGYDSWLVHSLPSAESRLSLLGYDPLVTASLPGQVVNPLAWPTVEQGLRAWGVSALLVSPTWNELGRPGPDEGRLLQWATAPGRIGTQVDGLWLIQVPDPDPLAWVEPGHRSAVIRWDVGGAEVDLPPGATSLTVATPSRPQWRAHVNGHRVALGMDGWRRLTMDLPVGAQRVRLDFKAPWGQGLVLGLGLVLAAAGGAVWLRRTEVRPG